MDAKLNRRLVGALTSTPEIPVAEEREKNDDHERREEKELSMQMHPLRHNTQRVAKIEACRTRRDGQTTSFA